MPATFIDLDRMSIAEEVIEIIPLSVAHRYKVIPVSRVGNVLSLAVADPEDIEVRDMMKMLSGLEVNLLASSKEKIERALERYYPFSIKEDISKLFRDIDEAKIKLLSERDRPLDTQTEEIIRLSQDEPVVKITNFILSQAVRLRASDILIEPFEGDLRIRYRIDGVFTQAESPPFSMHKPIVSRLKVMANLNIAEHRIPQDGRFRINMFKRAIDFRISIIPTIFGEKVALRILDIEVAPLDLAKLGFNQDALSKIERAAAFPHGMLLVCGPTGSGKTTTLYSILKYIDTPGKNIVTVEDPVEYDIFGVNQVGIHPDSPLTFASALRSILRQDPDVIMVGEMRDRETVDIAIRSALTGHLVLSTLHTTTAIGAIVRLINMGIEPFLISASLLLIGAQRLLRCLCKKCKYPYKIEGLTYYKAKGCPECRGTGYKGRVGILEVLVIDNKIKLLVLDNAPEIEIYRYALEAGMITLYKDAMNKAREGIVSLEEVYRFTKKDEVDVS